MSRKLRFEYSGAIYHVLNRGNYRSWIFESEGAKLSFEKTLFEACEYAGWKLHAFVVMSNHYHLAIETPEANLSEGMRWLQSVFAMRFNRFRKENGHLFQGRFKSIVVEDQDRLAWLCHYIHLNPVRAGICGVSGLKNYRYGSYWYLRDKRKRPGFLSLRSCLLGAGDLKDTSYGRNKYDHYLEWLNETDAEKKSMNFERMSKGWVLGSKEFKSGLLEEEKHLAAALELGTGEAREARELALEKRLKDCLKAVGKVTKTALSESKSAPWKAAIACHMRTRMLCPNGWLATALSMGSESHVSKLSKRTLTGELVEAKKLLGELNSRIKE